MDKARVTGWLRDIARDRLWLAKQCGVSKSTVDSWFSSRRDIPTQAQKQIERLMSDTRPQAPAEFRVVFEVAEFELIEAARHKSGHVSRPAFYHDAILDYSARVMKKAANRKR